MVSAGEKKHPIEVVLDGRADGGRHLKTAHASKAEYSSFSLPELQVRVFNLIVEPAPLSVAGGPVC